MAATRIIYRFDGLLDIAVTRAVPAWLRLNADGTVSERTASQTLGDIGAASSTHAANHAAGGTDPICYHSDTAPLTAEPGQKWLQTSTGREYEYFGGAWVEVASGPALDLSGYLTTADAEVVHPVNLLYNIHRLQDIDTFTGNNSGTTGASNSRSGTVATGWGRTIITSAANGFVATGSASIYTLRSNIPAAVAFRAAFVNSSGTPTVTTSRIRCVVGDAASGAPPNAATDPVSARGFGFEIYWSTVRSRMEIRLFAHDGTTLSYDTNNLVFDNGYTKERDYIVSSDGAGLVRLYLTAAMGPADIPTVPVLVASLSGGPTGSANNLAGPAISILTINDGTNVPDYDAFSSVSRARILLNYPTI